MSWSKWQLDLVDEIPPPMVAQLLMDAKDVLGWFPQVQCAIRSQAQRTETRVALLWQIWRSRRSPLLGEVEDVLASVIDCLTDQAGLKPCLVGAYAELHDDIWNALLHDSASVRSAAEQPRQEHKLVAWARDAEAVLETCGLGIKAVDGSGVFFHIPSRPMNVERQKQALIRVCVYHELEICWEPSCYATEQTSLSSIDCWLVPGEWFKRVSPLAAAIADEDAVVIPGYRRADEYPDYGDGARDCGCWDWVREGIGKAP